MTEFAKPALAPDERAQMAQALMQMITGFWPAQIVFAAHDLGIFRTLAEGPATPEALAEKLAFHPVAGKRLLTAALAIGLVERRGDAFANSPLADGFLVPGRPGYMGGFVSHARNDLYPLWGRLDDAVREGTPRWKQVFGAKDSNPFDEMYADPERLRGFLYAMQGGSLMAVESLLAAYDFSGHTTFMDVGGALGTVSVAVAKRYPAIRAVTFDLAPVAPLAEEYVASEGVADRVRVATGDMFERLPDGADVVHLSWILHDWSDEQCVTILTRCREALAPGGVVLIGEALLEDPPNGSVMPHLMSLNMLVATDGGSERTEAEYHALLDAAGLELVRVERTGGLRDLLVARRP